jgi:hypothetical protein
VLKLVLLAGITFLGSWIAFELIKRTPVTRLLFGLRPGKTAPSPSLAAHPDTAVETTFRSKT